MIPSLEISDLYRVFFRMRSIEQRIAAEYPLGEIRCPVHLSVGQELVSAAFAITQRPGDLAISTHRAHTHYLGKGGSLKKMIAELYGRVTGCSRGRGGSMHLVDMSVGFLGSSAIVGNSIPVGVGAALAQQISKRDAITYIFLGDGAVEEGSFYESLNFAALKGLRVIFVCENNLYSVYTGMSERQPEGRSISNIASALGVSTYRGDGTNPEICLSIFRSAREKCVSENKPQFLEFETYRWLEHCGPNDDDHLGYRPEGELRHWVVKDQLMLLKMEILKRKVLTETEMLDFEEEIRFEIETAFTQAKLDPMPLIEEILASAYAR